MNEPPKTLWEAFFRIAWGKKWMIALAIAAIVLFAIWNSIPSNVQEKMLTSLGSNEPKIETGNEDSIPKRRLNESELFFDTLSSEWKAILLASAGLPIENNSIDASELETIFNITQIDLEDRKVLDIKPLINGEFKKLSHLYGSQYLESIDGIEKITNLYFLDLSGSRITSLNSIFNLKSLRFLNISNTKITKAQTEELIKHNPHLKNEIKF
jgi:hypothetical protein